MIPWPHHVPRHLCVTIKIICFWQTSRWVTYAWLSSQEAARKAGQSWRQASCSSAAHTHKKRPLQSFPWFLFWAASMVSTVSQAPPKKWHILRPDALDSSTELWLLAGPSFLVRETGHAIFNQRWKFEYPSTPWAHQHPLPDIAGFQPRQGVSGGHGSHSEQRDSTMPLLAMLHLLSLTAYNPGLKAKNGYRWMIENAVRLVWSFMKAWDCLLVPLLAGSDCQWHSKKLYFPYIPTCLKGVSALWAVKSKMRMTSWDWEQNEGCQSSAVLDLMKKDKRLHTGQNNVCYTAQAGIIVFRCLHSLWTGKWLGTKTIFSVIPHCLSDLLFYLLLLVVMKKNDAAHLLHGEFVFANNKIMCAQFYHFFWFDNADHWLYRIKIIWALCALCTVGGVMGVFVVRSDKVHLQCINWINVWPQNVLCLEVLAAVQGVHSLHSLFGPH